MQLIRTGHGMAALLGLCLAMAAMAALAEEITLKPPRNAADIIRGHGGAEGLTLGDIRNYVALTRAEARARTLEVFLRADLDADGAVLGDEAQVYADSLSARSRGRFGKQFQLADLDQDANLSAQEVTSAGLVAALDALNREDEAALVGLLSLDADGNAAVDLAELRTGLARAKLVTKPASEDDDA